MGAVRYGGVTGSSTFTSGKLEIIFVVIALCEDRYRPTILSESVADVAGRAPRRKWGENGAGVRFVVTLHIHPKCTENRFALSWNRSQWDVSWSFDKLQGLKNRRP